MVVAEAYRNLIAVGATPLAMTDCLNYGSPEKKEIYQQLIDSTKGMSEACEVLKHQLFQVTFLFITKHVAHPFSQRLS